MAGISVNAPQSNPVDTLVSNKTLPPRDAKEKHPAGKVNSSTESQDTITLSSAARSQKTVAESNSTLSDTDAQSQSVNLRQLLGGNPLSGTAKQNQAILSLLR